MKSIFVCVEDLLPSQINLEIVEELNNYNKKNIVNTCVFFEHPFQNHFDIDCAVLNIGHIGSCIKETGETIIIATKLNHIELIKDINAEKFFYVFDPEFLDDTNFLRNNKLYRDATLITRSKTYQSLLRNNFNVDSQVLEFDLEKIWNLRAKSTTN